MNKKSSLFIIRLGYRRPMIASNLIVGATLFLLAQGFHDASLLASPCRTCC